MKRKLTEKQKRFCDEYLIDPNAKKAAINAGYSKKSASDIGHENLSKPYIKEYIEERLEEMESKKIATVEEIMQYLTSVLRGESVSEVLMVVGTGEGTSDVIRVMKHPEEREKLEAAKLIGKRYGMFKGDISAFIENITFIDDIKE